ncbi:MAG TPA: UDP-3-O-(3-hydroxymyristoyl)glucosamine N-acyltransferase [Candidatus Kapabacteria bacterium]|nr:UDP-3-O-(3-hydroxymyristoyl)glucosamine N-acyltransferase [Candidatus Kapabacteria bacterium]
MKLTTLAEQLGIERIEGSADGIEITSVRPIENAFSDSLSFIANPNYEKYISDTKAAAVIVGLDFKLPETGSKAILLRIADPYSAFAKALHLFDHRKSIFTERIASSAVISPEASIATTATIGANCFIAHDVTIGENSVIHPNAAIYDGVTIGSNCIIGPNTVIGFDGFGYAKTSDGSYNKIPQLGGVIIEDNVEIGACCTIDRAALAETIIKSGVKIDNLVQIAHNVEIGENTVIAAQVGISGSAKIGKDNQIAGQVGLVGHMYTADGVIIIAQSGVSKSLTKPGVYQGAPAKEVRSAFKQEAAIRMLPDLLDRVRKLEEKLRDTTK